MFGGSQPYKNGSKLDANDLYDALCHLRQKEHIMVWADALCINQRNLHERNHQVHQMRNIYAKAWRTVIYLGLYNGNTCHSAWNYLERECQGKLLCQDYPSFQGSLEDVEIAVLGRDWFRRVWVVQEIVVSRNPHVQCGRRSVSWDDFCKVVLLEPRVHDKYGFSLRNRHLSQSPANLFQARNAFHFSKGLGYILPSWHVAIEDFKAKSTHILDMLSRTRGLKATDSRDKIFGLLGISTGVEIENEGLAINYYKTVVDVYQGFTRYMIDSAKTYDVLSHVCGRFENEFWEQHYEGRFFPSWVPDWRLPLHHHQTILESLPVEDEQTREQRRNTVSQSHHWLTVWPLHFLISMGTVIGKISATSVEIQLDGGDEWTFQWLRDGYRDMPWKMNTEILRRWECFPWRRFRFQDTEVVSKRGYGMQDWVKYMLGVKGENSFFVPGSLSSVEYGSETKPELMAKSKRSSTDQMVKSEFESISNGKQSVSTPEPILDIKPNSIRDHMIRRARQTVLWNDDDNLTIAIVADKTSILDNRAFARYNSFVFEQGMESPSHPDKLCLVPANSRPGDMIVALYGGRVPFVVRPSENDHILKKDPDDPPEVPTYDLKGKLIGECLIDDYEQFDVVLSGDSLEPSSRDWAFIFEDW